MPLYKVRVEVEALIYADDMRTAQLDGQGALQDELKNLYWHDVEVSPVESAFELPFGWTKTSLVYHAGREDLTVAEALNHRKTAEEGP
jgi:hypothetical protein